MGVLLASPRADGPGPGRPRSASTPGAAVAFALLASVQFASILAITTIVIALPTIQAELGIGSADLTLLTTAYGLAYSGLLLLGGRLADTLGSRTVFTLGTVAFGLGSAIGGLAPSYPVLLAARFWQGVGAALAAPAAMALLGAVFPTPHHRTRALALWGGLSSAGATSGILLSGLITAWDSWRSAFLVPVVAGFVAASAAHHVLPPGPPPARRRLDVAGAALWTAGLVALTYGLAASVDHPLSSPGVAVPLLGGGGLLAAFLALETRTPLPLLPLSFLRSRRRATGLLAVLLISAGTASTSYFLALYFQQVRHLTPVEASAAFLPYGSVLAAGLVAGRLVARLGPEAVLTAGLLLMAAGLGLLGLIGVDTPYVGPPLAGLLLTAIGTGLAFAGATVVAVDTVPADQGGLAGGVVNTVMEVGPATGLALLAAVAGARTDRLIREGLDLSVATTSGYVFVFGLSGLAFLASAVTAGVVLRPGRDGHTLGRWEPAEGASRAYTNHPQGWGDRSDREIRR